MRVGSYYLYRHSVRGSALLICLIAFSASLANAQIVGINVNMVSGTQPIDGDPFLQRQNEPAIAASTRNPLHLLAGANDYRTVDLPGLPGNETGDAWLGLFKSLDGGQTWTSTLVPGCPQTAPQCDSAASPIKGYQAASDPVVRAGTNGLFYYSGLAFQRDETKSAVFVSRFIDNNNTETGDPIQYIGTSVVKTSIVQNGNGAPFLDKPWIAVDIPRASSLICSIGTQSFPGGNVYVAYTGFNGDLSRIYTSVSKDCGATWTVPLAVSDGTAADQGAVLAVEPVSGAVYLAWRRIPVSSAGPAFSTGSIMVAKSTDGGSSFSAPVAVTSFTGGINAFDLTLPQEEFRSNVYPSLTFDSAGRAYMAWSEVGLGPNPQRDARVVISTSTNGVNWSQPELVDPSPAPGHQFMPVVTFGSGKLMIAYYDTRDDSTYIELDCPPQNLNCTTISDRVQTHVPAGDLLPGGNPGNVFNMFIADSTGILRRHTIDVRTTQANPAAAPVFNFPSVRVSDYLTGSTTAFNGTKPIVQLRFNVPDLPLFAQGTAPFIGDYIDLAPAPAFLPVTTGTRTTWRFNLDPTSGAVFHAVWADNRDVVPPPDLDWTKYTPPKPVGPSLADPTQTTPPCDPARTGMRNQNIYTAHVVTGLPAAGGGIIAGSPGNTKPLNTSVPREFVVFVQNDSESPAYYRLTIPPGSQPPGGQASFLSGSAMTQLDVQAAGRTSVARTVFVTSSNPQASVQVNVAQFDSLGNPLPSVPGTAGSVVLNPDLTNPDLTNPDLTNHDVYNPDLTNPSVTNPDLTNPDLTNPDVKNPDLTNIQVTNPDLTNMQVTNPDLTNPNIPNPDLTNPDLTNPDLTNPDLTNPDLTNTTISDTVWTLTNNGNTTAAYSLRLLLQNQAPQAVKLQLLVYKVYTGVPIAQGCTVGTLTQNQLLVNIPKPDQILADGDRSMLTNPDLTNGSANNATVAIAPGSQARIVLRTATPVTMPEYKPADSVTVVAVPHIVTPTTPLPPVAASRITIITSTLPDAVRTLAYTASVLVAGKPVGATIWAISGGSLPPGLILNSATGAITGTPTSSGVYNFAVSIVDTGASTSTDRTSLSIRVSDPLAIVTGPVLTSGILGQAYSALLNATGGAGTLTWSVNSGALPNGLTMNSATGTISGVALAGGTFTFQAKVVDSSSPQQMALLAGANITIVTPPSSAFASTNYPSGAAGLDALLTADFNHDGALDLVAISPANNSFYFLKGNGDGTFQSGVPFSMASTTGANPELAVAADFNNDGNLDLAVLHPTTTALPNGFGNQVTIHLGDGTGGFAIPGTVLFTGGSDVGIATADFNKDGNADLAVGSCDDGTVHLYTGGGNATFVETQALQINSSCVGGQNFRLKFADVNGDGWPDLLATFSGNAGVNVFINQSGSFGGGTLYSTGSLQPIGIAVADFNSDGIPDIAVSETNSNTVNLLAGIGGGAFTSAGSRSVGATPVDLVTADVDGSGVPGLVTANSGGSSVSSLPGVGDGSFPSRSDIATGASPTSVVAGDFNGDGKTDIAVALGSSGTVTVLLNSLLVVEPAWKQLAPVGGPPPARGFQGVTAIYNSAANRMVMFGGRNAGGSNLNDVWLLTNANGNGGTGQWTNPVANGAPGSPAARSGHTAVYDSANDNMIVFGGCFGACNPVGNDVWVLRNASGAAGTPSWAQLSPTGTPPAGRAQAAAVYDPVNNRMIVFGGQNGDGSVLFSDVWVLSHANGLGGTPAWSKLSPLGGPPLGQYGATAVYDAVTNTLIAFGGSGLPVGFVSNATWALSHANGLGGLPVWTNLVAEGAPGAPPARSHHTAVYDASRSRMTVFGGNNGLPQMNDVWTLRNANGVGGPPVWVQQIPVGGPPPARQNHTAVYDPVANRMSIFGGSSGGGFLNDTWVLSPGVP